MVVDVWTFAQCPGVMLDTVNNADFLHQVYTAAEPDYSGRVTVPLLWDKQRCAIVNNESSEIIRMLTGAFDGVGAAPGAYYPAPLRPAIAAPNERIYDGVNTGVYQGMGSATCRERVVHYV